MDYGQPLTEAVICPYSGSLFSTGDGEAMKRHQQENRHPGWGRYHDRPVEKKWIFFICSLVRATTSDAKPSGSATPISDSK